MARNYLSINANYNDFSQQKSPVIDKFLQENNSLVLSKIYSFFQKQEKLLLLTGFSGTGKKQLVKHILCYLDKDVDSLKINCSRSLTLDDLLLNLWAQFITVPSNSEIAYKYRHITSFQERLTNCLSKSENNIVITLFNFELLSEENAEQISKFLWEILPTDNLKVIITSRIFDTTIIPENISYTKIILKALSRIIFEKYLKERNINATSRMYDELYKITRGYFLYTQISANILNKKNLSINDYLIAYTNSAMSFDKFLAKAYISMLPNSSQELLFFLATVRHPINSSTLDYIDKYNQTDLDTLEKFDIVNLQDNLYIVNPYFSEAAILEFEGNTEKQTNIRNILIKFYNSQLSLKPSERLLLISRITMRSEIDFHSKVSSNEKVLENINTTPKEFEYTTYQEVKSFAQKLLKEFKYQDALKLYLKMLDDKESDKIHVYENLSSIYEKLGNIKYAFHYLNALVSMTDSEINVKYQLNIARLYYQTYKTNEAISTLNNVISQSVDTQIIIEAYMLLGNIYISHSKRNEAYEIYNKAVILIENKDNNIKNKSELYFKFAILADENEQLETAKKYYNLCIECAGDFDKYKSLSYSNLGDLYLDLENKELALENFKQAYFYDKKNNNDYGMYYTAYNIAKLVLKNNTDEGYTYLIKSQTAAVKTNDIFAMANAGLHLGDYYSNNSNFNEALKEYLSVLNLVREKFSPENIKKIQIRIEDIKYKIGNEEFNELYKRYHV